MIFQFHVGKEVLGRQRRHGLPWRRWQADDEQSPGCHNCDIQVPPRGSVMRFLARSIGDRAWKGSMGGMAGSLKLVRSVPETRFTAP